MSSRPRKVTEATETNSLSEALDALEEELRATDLLALNATIKSAQTGATGEELFATLQLIRERTQQGLKQLAQLSAARQA